jgi:hypothetical protein
MMPNAFTEETASHGLSGHRSDILPPTGLLVLLLSGLVSVSTFAQYNEPSARDSSSIGFWIGLGLGYGTTSAVCLSCGENGQQGASTGSVQLGFRIGKDILIGVRASMAVDGWGLYNNTREDKIYRNHLMVVGSYYFHAHQGFWGELGVGLSSYSAYNRYQPPGDSVAYASPASLVHAEGPGFLIALGYDFPISAELSLGPTLEYTHGQLGSFTLSETQTLSEKSSLNILGLSLVMTFHPDS